MSPLPLMSRMEDVAESDPRPPGSRALVLEAWAQGYMVGSLVIMAVITMANMRRGVRLHKLILIELLLGLWQGFWLFLPSSPGRRVDTWWLSGAAIPLNASWVLHNLISWMKIKPFLSPLWNKIYFTTVLLSIPYWVIEIYANFAYFHYANPIFNTARPLELLFRDPWWIVSTVYLFIVIKTQYDLRHKEIIRISPRFGIMLASMLVAIIFVICDVLSTTKAINLPGDIGINPFWKLAFVFKCLTDSVILDDFKTALDRLRAFKISRLGSFSGDHSDKRTRSASHQIRSWSEEYARKAGKEIRREQVTPSLDGPTPTNLDGAKTFSLFQNDSGVLQPQEEDVATAPGLGRDPEDVVTSMIEPAGIRPLRPAYHPQDVQRPWRPGLDTNAGRDPSVEEHEMVPHDSNVPLSHVPSPRTKA